MGGKDVGGVKIDLERKLQNYIGRQQGPFRLKNEKYGGQPCERGTVLIARGKQETTKKKEEKQTDLSCGTRGVKIATAEPERT